jgi:hypothetical protein
MDEANLKLGRKACRISELPNNSLKLTRLAGGKDG